MMGDQTEYLLSIKRQLVSVEKQLAIMMIMLETHTKICSNLTSRIAKLEEGASNAKENTKANTKGESEDTEKEEGAVMERPGS